MMDIIKEKLDRIPDTIKGLILASLFCGLLFSASIVAYYAADGIYKIIYDVPSSEAEISRIIDEIKDKHIVKWDEVQRDRTKASYIYDDTTGNIEVVVYKDVLGVKETNKAILNIRTGKISSINKLSELLVNKYKDNLENNTAFEFFDKTLFNITGAKELKKECYGSKYYRLGKGYVNMNEDNTVKSFDVMDEYTNYNYSIENITFE